MSAVEIPVVVQEAILKSRKYFHDLDANARRESDGLSGFAAKPLELIKEKQFWTIEDDEELHDFLFEDLLALYSEIDLKSLPAGYKPLVLVLEFERHCVFSGWYAVENRTDNELHEIIESYEYVELKGEAKALRAVAKAYALLSDSAENDLSEYLEAISKLNLGQNNLKNMYKPLQEFVHERTNQGSMGTARAVAASL